MVKLARMQISLRIYVCIYIINLSRDNISNFYLTKSFDMSPQFSGLAGRPRLRGRATCRDRSCVRACSTHGNSRRNKLKLLKLSLFV